MNMEKFIIYDHPDNPYPKQYITFTDDNIEISKINENDQIIMRSFKHYLWEIMLILNKSTGDVDMIPIRPIKEEFILNIFRDFDLSILITYPWKESIELQDIIWTLEDIKENPLVLTIKDYNPRNKNNHFRRNDEGGGNNGYSHNNIGRAY